VNNHGRNYAEILKKSVGKWNSQDLDGYMNMYYPSIDAKGFPGVQLILDSLKDFYQVFWSSVPGSQIMIDDLIEKDDKLVCRFLVTGKHTRTFIGIPPSDKDVQFNGITILQFNENDNARSAGIRRPFWI
jgi:hypothetical protein